MRDERDVSYYSADSGKSYYYNTQDQNYTVPKTEKVGNISLLKRDRIALQYFRIS